MTSKMIKKMFPYFGQNPEGMRFNRYENFSSGRVAIFDLDSPRYEYEYVWRNDRYVAETRCRTQLVLNESSLRVRLNNLNKGGLEHSTTKAALKNFH